jgi:YVTN family beta-propeller protein
MNRVRRAIGSGSEQLRRSDASAVKRTSGALIASIIALASAGVVCVAASGKTAPLPHGGRVTASIRIPAGIGGFAVGEGAVWAVTGTLSPLMRIDPKENAVVARLKIERQGPCLTFPGSCGEVAAGNGGVWVSNPSDNTVTRIDPRTTKVVATIPVGPQPVELAASPGAVWVSNDGGPSVSRIDPATNQVVATIRVGPAESCCSGHMAVTTGAGAVWVSVPNLNALVRIDPTTNAVAATIRLPGSPYGFLVADGHAVWAASAHAGSVIWRIDPRSNRQTGTVTGQLIAPIGLALGFGSLWVADLDAKTIDRVNPSNGRIVARLRVGGYPIRLGIGSGSVWVRDDTGRVLRINPLRKVDRTWFSPSRARVVCGRQVNPAGCF